MQLSCGAPRDTASPELLEKIAELGLEPIVTSQIIRVLYVGTNHQLAEQIVALFRDEIGHDVSVQYDKSEREDGARQARIARNRKVKKGHRR